MTASRPRMALLVLWPAFVAACLLELLVFALVDPQALQMPDGSPLALSRTAVYSLAFFAFWAATAMAAATALWLHGGGAAPRGEGPAR